MNKFKNKISDIHVRTEKDKADFYGTFIPQGTLTGVDSKGVFFVKNYEILSGKHGGNGLRIWRPVKDGNWVKFKCKVEYGSTAGFVIAFVKKHNKLCQIKEPHKFRGVKQMAKSACKMRESGEIMYRPIWQTEYEERRM